MSGITLASPEEVASETKLLWDVSSVAHGLGESPVKGRVAAEESSRFFVSLKLRPQTQGLVTSPPNQTATGIRRTQEKEFGFE